MDPRKPIRVFIGADPRQPVALSVLQDSINWRSSHPVTIQLLKLDTLPIMRRGLTDFTFSRFLVPWLCGYEGTAIFMDSDILVTGDIKDMALYFDHTVDVQVFQDQPKFEWSSVMLFNNDKCRVLTPEFIDNPKNSLFDFSWADCVGSLPAEWNHCVGYTECDNASLHHFTEGVPVWEETKGNFQEDDLWTKQFRHMNSTVSWETLMSRSVHAPNTLKRQRIRNLRRA